MEKSEWEEYEKEETRTPYALQLSENVRKWTQDKNKEEVFHLGQKFSAPVGAVYSPEELADSPQLRARAFFVSIDHPEAGEIEYPSAPYRFSRTPWAVHQPAPLLGQHNEEVYRELLGCSHQEMMRMRETGVI